VYRKRFDFDFRERIFGSSFTQHPRIIRLIMNLFLFFFEQAVSRMRIFYVDLASIRENESFEYHSNSVN